MMVLTAKLTIMKQDGMWEFKYFGILCIIYLHTYTSIEEEIKDIITPRHTFKQPSSKIDFILYDLD